MTGREATGSKGRRMAGEASKCETGTSLTRSLYRVVSEAEYKQIQRTKRFKSAGGAEGKYFWEGLEDAIMWSKAFSNVRIIEAKYPAALVETLFGWDQLDGLGPARFADESQMNQSLLEVGFISESESDKR